MNSQIHSLAMHNLITLLVLTHIYIYVVHSGVYRRNDIFWEYVRPTINIHNKPGCYSVQLEHFCKRFFLDFFSRFFWEILWDFFFLRFGFSLVWFSCIPSFDLLLCLELVKKFSEVVVGGWVGVESSFSVQLWSKP